MFHNIYTSFNKHADDFGGSVFGLIWYLIKTYLASQLFLEDLHTLVMAGLSAVVGFLFVMIVRKVISTGEKKGNGNA